VDCVENNLEVFFVSWTFTNSGKHPGYKNWHWVALQKTCENREEKEVGCTGIYDSKQLDDEDMFWPDFTKKTVNVK